MREPYRKEEGVGGVVPEIIDGSPDSISENIVTTHSVVMIWLDCKTEKPVFRSFSNRVVKNDITVHCDFETELMDAQTIFIIQEINEITLVKMSCLSVYRIGD